MGFDLYISVKFHMCDGTGKPYYITRKDYSKCYDISAIVVPEHLRKYCYHRGGYLHAYTDTFNVEERFEVEASEFLENFPTWEDVSGYEGFEEKYDFWNEDDHNMFKELLEWCVKQDAFFHAEWSY